MTNILPKTGNTSVSITELVLLESATAWMRSSTTAAHVATAPTSLGEKGPKHFTPTFVRDAKVNHLSVDRESTSGHLEYALCLLHRDYHYRKLPCC